MNVCVIFLLLVVSFVVGKWLCSRHGTGLVSVAWVYVVYVVGGVLVRDKAVTKSPVSRGVCSCLCLGSGW